MPKTRPTGASSFRRSGSTSPKQITKDLRVGIQLFAEDLGPTGNYDPKVDWFYLDYRWKDWLGLRAGRVKIPFGLYNEINDVDSARVPILLPQSIYPVENTNYLLAQTGGEVYGYVRMGEAGAIDYGLYGGTILVDTLIPPNSPYQVQDLNVPYVAGGRVLWETPAPGLRLGGTLQTLRIDATFLSAGQSAKVEIPATLWVASAEYVVHYLTLAAEYSRWTLSDSSTDPKLLPTSPPITSERGYVMATYRAASWLQPAFITR